MSCRIMGIALMACITLGLSACGGGAGCDTKTVAPGPSGGPSISVGGSGGSCGTNSGSGGGPNGGPGQVTLGTPIDTVFFVKTAVNPTISAAGVDGAKNFLPLPSFVPTSLAQDDHPGMEIVNETFLYLAGADIGEILGFSIDSTSGNLTPIAGSPFPTAVNAMTVDATGRFLYIGNGSNTTIVGFHINSTNGSLTPIPGSPFPTLGMRFVNALTTDGLGKLLYVTEGVGGSNMNAFFINASNGALTPVAGNPVSVPVSFLKSEPTGKFLVGIDAKVGTSGIPSNPNIYVFAINQSTGAIAQAPLSPFTSSLPPIRIFVHPNGRFIYTTDDNVGGGLGPMQGFTLDSAGKVTPMSGSPFSGLERVSQCDSDHISGAELFCSDGSTFFAYDVDLNTGNLSRTAAPFVSGQNLPFAVAAPR